VLNENRISTESHIDSSDGQVLKLHLQTMVENEVQNMSRTFAKAVNEANVRGGQLQIHIERIFGVCSHVPIHCRYLYLVV
jgi:hypothetical protein